MALQNLEVLIKRQIEELWSTATSVNSGSSVYFKVCSQEGNNVENNSCHCIE